MKNLIIVRAGKSSQHTNWLQGEVTAHRNWDLYVSPYESDDPSVVIEPGLKFVGLYALLREWTGWQDYSYVTLADDDFIVPPGTWSRFFDKVTALNAKLAAPAMMIGSVVSHPVTMQAQPTGARRTTFVEILTPCFRTDILKSLLPTFGLVDSGLGFGLDYLWPHLLRYDGIYVIDETPILRPRPARDIPENAAGIEEMSKILRLYGAAKREETLELIPGC